MTATTGTKPGQQSVQEPKQAPRPEPASLEGCYGEIGIPAVTAALQFTGGSKDPAGATLAPRIDLRFVEMVA